ncbi:MAG: winged helix-turn-helix domain-containing protein [Flavobacteriales bacterium]|nr:winged helix-turn-helix domain-containing protein [Flavobacteriales bacterium]
MILTQEQQKQTLRLIADKMPDQLKLPYALWSRKAIALLIKERFGVVLPERTMTDYLSRWGFSAPKPMRRAAEQRPELVRKWREEVYPAIERRAELEGADIHWGMRPACAMMMCVDGASPSVARRRWCVC